MTIAYYCNWNLWVGIFCFLAHSGRVATVMCWEPVLGVFYRKQHKDVRWVRQCLQISCYQLQYSSLSAYQRDGRGLLQGSRFHIADVIRQPLKYDVFLLMQVTGTKLSAAVMGSTNLFGRLF
jgi:hypothetical protein